MNDRPDTSTEQAFRPEREYDVPGDCDVCDGWHADGDCPLGDGDWAGMGDD